MKRQGELPEGFSETDIFFDCPGCGKSLAIDQRGAGLIVRCPDCGTRMQVPFLETPEKADISREHVPAASARAEGPKPETSRLAYSDEDAEAHRRYLEKLRLDYLWRFEKIREEIAVIQAGLDRMVAILEEIRDHARAGQ